MKCFLKSLTLIIVLLASSSAFAEALPKWNIRQACKADSDLAACLAFEGNAFSKVSGPWATIPPKVRDACISKVVALGQQSYRVLRDCLEEKLTADYPRSLKTGK